jgi:hypothetical protein
MVLGTNVVRKELGYLEAARLATDPRFSRATASKRCAEEPSPASCVDPDAGASARAARRDATMAAALSPQASSVSATRLVLGFVAGFIATLIFHQIGLLLLHIAGMTQAMPYDAHPVPPFGVPQFISLAFGAIYGAASISWPSPFLRADRPNTGSAPSSLAQSFRRSSRGLLFSRLKACRPVVVFTARASLLGPSSMGCGDWER